MAGNKKNIIPLVLAVVLALAAVFAVNRLIGQKTPMAGEEIVEVVVAARPLAPGDLINEGAFTKKQNFLITDFSTTIKPPLIKPAERIGFSSKRMEPSLRK